MYKVQTGMEVGEMQASLQEGTGDEDKRGTAGWYVIWGHIRYQSPRSQLDQTSMLQTQSSESTNHLYAQNEPVELVLICLI